MSKCINCGREATWKCRGCRGNFCGECGVLKSYMARELTCNGCYALSNPNITK